MKFMKDFLECARREFFRRKARTMLNIFGYFLAVGIMIVMITLLRFSKYAENNIAGAVGTHFMAYLPACGEIASLTPSEIEDLMKGKKPPRCEGKCKECTGCNKKPIDLKNEGFFANSISTRLLPVTMVDEVKKFSDVIKDASPFLSFRFKHSSDGHLFIVGGFDPASKEAVGTTCCAKGDLVAGKFIEPSDSGVVMLEQGYAMARKIEIDKDLEIAGENFRVIGIVNPGVRPAKADVYMTFRDAEKVINKRIKSPLFGEMNVLLVEVTESSKQDAAIEKVKEIMESGVVTSYACYKPASQIIGINEGSVWLISMILCLGAGVLSMKSQLASVIERRRDIGILKAIGWTNGTIVSQILAESVIQSMAGGIFGCVGAAAIIFFIPVKDIIGIQAQIDFFAAGWAVLAGLLAALSAGVLAGILPAYNASRQNPAEILRRI